LELDWIILVCRTGGNLIGGAKNTNQSKRSDKKDKRRDVKKELVPLMVLVCNA